MGIINAGTAVGAVLAPPLIAIILGFANWRWIFLLTGAIGLLWVAWWRRSYFAPPEIPDHAVGDSSAKPTAAADSAMRFPWTHLFRIRETWGLVTAKFLSDAAWFFYLFWLPKYLYDARGFDIKSVGLFAWMPHAAAGVGCLVGGAFSSYLVRRHFSVGLSRKIALGASAIVMPFVILVPHVTVTWAMAIFCLAYFGQQSWSTLVMVLPTDLFPQTYCRIGRRPCRFRRSDGRDCLRATGRLLVGSRLWIRHGISHRGHTAYRGVSDYSRSRSRCFAFAAETEFELRGSSMKITEIRTRVLRWRGKTVPLPPHFCTNPMDLLELPEASMQTFTFHGWMVVEVFTDDGHVGLGNAALAPQATKQVIDLYLKPLLIGQDPWDIERLWQHMYRKTMAFGRKGIGMAAISALDIALWDLLGKSAKQPVFRLLGGRTKARIPVYASRLYATELGELGAEAKRYKDEGYQAMKLRFGWGPADGARGMQRNIELVRTVRETIGDEVDLMADAYMGWTLDYAKRMLPLLEPFHLRWLEEPVIPDDIHGYAELKSYGRIPIAGGEHEFTLFGFRDLLEARALDYIQFDTNRVGGITQARKIAALAEAYSVPVIPHAGQMHNYHIVMASLNSPMAEYFPIVDVEVGNELFWYIFDGEPRANGGYINLDDNTPGLGLTINEAGLDKFEVFE